MARTRRLIHALSSQMDENNPRGFTQIALEVTGVEVGRIRFSSESDTAPPQIAQWRNNLTALSQYHNLYFVAYSDEIHVYQPRFPDQRLGNRPVMIIKPPVSRPGLRGYIDSTCPHAANFLLVDDLGDEEVLAIACDDGDVLLYHTRSVANKVKSKIERGSLDEEAAADQINPFFHDNFHVSAWGLAMHKAARMLAISSNTQNIDVIAFGLCSPNQRSSDGSSDEDMEPPGPDDSGTTLASTSGNSREERRVTLRGHGTNIPCVAFCNNNHDRHGQWLASTDIDGVMLVWDIWTQEIVARHEFGEVPRLGHHADMWAERRCGWGVLCLDRSMFKVTSGLAETYGSDQVSPTKPVDISLTRNYVKDSSSGFGFQVPTNPQAAFVVDADDDSSSDEDPEIEFFSDVDDDDDDDDEEDDDDNDDDEDEEDDDEEGPGGAGVELDPNVIEMQVQALIAQNFADIVGPEYAEQPESSTGTNGTDTDDQPDEDDIEEVIEGATDSHDEEEHVDSNQEEGQERASTTQARIPYPPRFSIVHTTETVVRMLSTPYTGPTTICRRALHQVIPPALHFLAPLERLNMINHVPELSLVVIGNQIGRVGLFTLTRDPEDGVGFRLEYLLPFASQEAEGMRPARCLLGVAVGPIQGREKVVDPYGFDETSPRRNREQLWNKVEKTRRYRLMLTYNDHTVLSYEIGRDNNPSAGRDGELTVV